MSEIRSSLDFRQLSCVPLPDCLKLGHFMTLNSPNNLAQFFPILDCWAIPISNINHATLCLRQFRHCLKSGCPNFKHSLYSKSPNILNLGVQIPDTFSSLLFFCIKGSSLVSEIRKFGEQTISGCPKSRQVRFSDIYFTQRHQCYYKDMHNK